MIRICPNKATPEWKRMVKHLDSEAEAYRAFMAHNYTIPNAIPMSELKKTIGMTGGPYSPKRVMLMNMRIRKFNEQNGTSHGVKTQRFGSNSFKAEIAFNYLPVNKDAQADRDRRRRMQGYVGLMDGESFENVHDPASEPFTPSESEMEAGRWEDGDFLPPAPSFNATQKAGPRFRQYMETKQLELRDLYSQRDKLIVERKKSKDKAQRQRYSAKINVLSEKAKQLETNINQISTFDRLDQIRDFAEEDMRTLENILNSPEPKISDLVLARRIIDIWQKAADFSGNHPHIYYTPAEFKHKFSDIDDITQQFKAWGNKADTMNEKLIQLEENVIRDKIQTVFKAANIDFSQPLPDIGFLSRHALDISEINYVLFQAIHKWVKDADTAAHHEITNTNKKLDELIDKTGLDNFEIFQQNFSNTDSRKTGELVYRWTQSFFDWENSLDRRRDTRVDKASKEADVQQRIKKMVSANRDYVNDLRKKVIAFDPRILFWDQWDEKPKDAKRPTQAEIDAHVAELKGILGERGYQKYYEYSENKINEYKEARAARKDNFDAQYGEGSENSKFHFASWISKSSPFLYAQALEEGYDAVRFNGMYLYPENYFIRTIPRRIDLDGNETGFYDEKFEQIEDNDDYRELYDYMFDMLQELKHYLPHQKINFMNAVNALPFIRKNTMENMTGSTGSLSAGFERTKEVVLEATRMEDLSTIGPTEDRKEFQLQMLTNHRARIKDRVNLRTIEYQNQNKGASPGIELIEQWRKEVINEIAEEKSFDLGRVLKAFAAMAITYKHRSAIEDQMRIAEQIVKRAVEKKQNAAGEEMTDPDKNILFRKGLDNLVKMFSDFMDVAYWGYPSNRPEGKTSKKVLTANEKIAINALESARDELEEKYKSGELKITESEYERRKDILTDQIDVIGGVRVYSKYGDAILKYIQIKGMGWNLFAGFANLGFGLISNLIEGSDGRNYSMKSYRKAMALTLNSVGRNFSFNTWDGLNGQAKKIRILMEYYDTLKTSKDELYKTTTKTLFKKVGDKIEWLNPYNPQTRTEYFNQAPVMIAMLMEQKVTTADGEEMSLWDAYDVDGKIAEGVDFEKGSQLDLDMKSQIDKVVKMNHGNYDPGSPLSAKRYFFGRAVFQFRTWAAQGFQERWMKEMEDHNLVDRRYDKDFVLRKGRYRSYGAYFQAHNGLMGVGPALSMAYELTRKLMWKETTFDKMVGKDGFTEADAANMRKNMTEILIWLSLAMIALALKSMDFDDDDKKRLAVNFLINQGARLSTDIAFYTNPLEFERLFRNAVPAFSLVVDTQKFFDSFGTLISGGDDILQSGPNKGMSRTWRDFQKLVPGANQYYRIVSASEQVYKK